MKSTIGERLREARENKSMDQATLATKAGIVTRTLQRWEKGEQVPDGLYITKIAKATSVQASWLLTGEGEMYPAPARPDNVYPLTPSGRRKGPTRGPSPDLGRPCRQSGNDVPSRLCGRLRDRG